jgi:hypothetical protein
VVGDGATRQGLSLRPDEFMADHRTRGRRRFVALLTLLVVAGLIVAAVLIARRPSGPSTNGGVSVATTAVTRGDVIQTAEVSGTVGYSGSLTVYNQASGVLTNAPSVGQTISNGQVLYYVNEQPIVLLYGSVPAYRDLAEGDTGVDVAQLNYDLSALGYVSTAVGESDDYTAATVTGVEDLQKAIGFAQTGSLSLVGSSGSSGDGSSNPGGSSPGGSSPSGSSSDSTLPEAVFVGGAVRVTSVSATVGSSVAPGVALIDGTSTTEQVSIQLDPSLQTQVAVGAAAEIELPDGNTTPGTVSSVGTVATTSGGDSGSGPGGGGTTYIPVTVNLTDRAEAGSLDQAPVTVRITTSVSRNVLRVPIDSLLALSEGGYAVEVVGPSGVHRLVGVSTGTFDDVGGVVAVTPTSGELAPGDRVVVPSQ